MEKDKRQQNCVYALVIERPGERAELIHTTDREEIIETMYRVMEKENSRILTWELYPSISKKWVDLYARYLLYKTNIDESLRIADKMFKDGHIRTLFKLNILNYGH